MSLKQEIETWVQALAHYDSNEFEDALRVFSDIADTSKILFNCGVIHATIGEHGEAVKCYQRSIGLDQYLAVAYFQEGVSNFLVGDFEEALANFNDTLLYLRGNTFIDYEQLGLKFKLYSCEVLFNRGLCYMYLQQDNLGMQDFQYAVKEKLTPDHDVIDDAIREKAQGYTVFSIPVGIVYRPNEAKVKNLKTKDYLGRARLVATANASNVSTGFQGADRRKETEQLVRPKDDRPVENISFAATNLVNRNIVSRSREQSAPPAMGRPQFPPTPPPESDARPRGNVSPQTNIVPPRSASVRNPGPRNLPPLQIGSSNGRTESIGGLERSNTFDFNLTDRTREPSSATESTRSGQNQWGEERPRLATMRSNSETRGPSTRRTHAERSSSMRTPNMNNGSGRTPNMNSTTPRPLYGETPRMGNPIPEDNEPIDDVYNMYGQRRAPSNRQPNPRQQQQQQQQQPQRRYSQEEEDEDIIIESDSGDEGEAPQQFRTSNSFQQQQQPQTRSASQTRNSYITRERKVDMKKIRIKFHASNDIRYIMIPTTTVDYDDMESRVRAKFGLRGRLMMKTKDEDCGDMVTLSDQDDLDTLVASAKAQARKERTEMGKMEIWVQES